MQQQILHISATRIRCPLMGLTCGLMSRCIKFSVRKNLSAFTVKVSLARPAMIDGKRMELTQLSQKVPGDSLIDTASTRMRPIHLALGLALWSPVDKHARSRLKIERSHFASVLDIDGEVGPRAILHDQVDVGLALLPCQFSWLSCAACFAPIKQIRERIRHLQSSPPAGQCFDD